VNYYLKRGEQTVISSTFLTFQILSGALLLFLLIAACSKTDIFSARTLPPVEKPAGTNNGENIIDTSHN
jgi:hypothetical protein